MATRPHVHIDFETYSEVDLTEVGSFRYAEDPTTEALILGYSIGKSAPKAVDLTAPGALPKLTPLFEAIRKGARVTAHNVTFERNIWTKVCKFPVTPREDQWDCTAVRSRLLAMPGSLDGCAAALGLEIRKDPRGQELIKIFCKPGKKGRVRPVDMPLAFQEFMEYCKQDVRVEMEIDEILPPIPDVEREAFLLDYRINDRGMPVNLPAVNRAIAFVEEYSAKIEAEAVAISNCRPTQREKTLEFLRSRGFAMPNLQRGTVEEMAQRKDLPPDVQTLLAHRVELSRAGTKKLVTIRACASEDGRIRGGFLFSAASTRRWSSVGVQMHNLQKPESKEANPDVVLDMFEADCGGFLPTLFSSPLTAVAESIRGFFQSETGFHVADFASIEPRGLAWSADEQWLLKAYWNKEDAYKIAAGKVFGIDPSKVNAEQRFLGKQLILGCFGPETQVLSDSGWKRIVDIQLTDRLWDGVEFVEHGGVVNQGVKEVIDLWGTAVTPDHLILTGSQWSSAMELKAEPDGNNPLSKSALASATLPCWPTGSGTEGASASTSVDANVVGSSTFEPRTSLESLDDAPSVPAPPPSQHAGKTMSNPSLHPQEPSPPLTTGGPGDCSGICTTGLPDCIPLTDPTTTPLVASRSANGGGPSSPSSKTSSSCPAGRYPVGSSIESTTSGATGRGTAGSSPIPSPTSTRLGVFDIVNCGPRTRFCVLTDRGALLVHNCGYGMGPPRFIESCRKFGVDISLNLAESSVYGYRDSVPNIVQFWKTVEACAIKAVKYWRDIPFGRFKFRPITLSNGYPILMLDMPSGSIAYPKPAVAYEEWYGAQRPKLEFYSVLGSTFHKTDTFGGSLTENVIQALTRDLLRDGMVKADKQGHYLIGHCHDEAIAENDTGKEGLRAFEDALCTASDWADGIPIVTEGYVANRYKK